MSGPQCVTPIDVLSSACTIRTGFRLAQATSGAMIVAFYNGDPDEVTFRVGVFFVVALCVYGLWQLIRWLVNAPHTADPWDAQISEEISKDDTTPLCHRCLAPHHPQQDFCPDCGATVGTFTNWLPYPYIFSVGHTLRLGTDGAFRRSPLTIAGFIIFAVCEYTVFAPVYLVIFFKNLLSGRQASPSAPTSGNPQE